MALLVKRRLDNIRKLWNSNYVGQEKTMIPQLLSHIDALQEKLDEFNSSGQLTVNVGAIQATIDSGPDGKLGTKDDEVKLKRAPRKRKPAAKKKTAAKKKS